MRIQLRRVNPPQGKELGAIGNNSVLLSSRANLAVKSINDNYNVKVGERQETSCFIGRGIRIYAALHDRVWRTAGINSNNMINVGEGDENESGGGGWLDPKPGEKPKSVQSILNQVRRGVLTSTNRMFFHAMGRSMSLLLGGGVRLTRQLGVDILGPYLVTRDRSASSDSEPWPIEHQDELLTWEIWIQMSRKGFQPI